MNTARTKGAFTLIELLVVIAIIGLLAVISVPAIRNFGRSDAMLAAQRQMLDDIARARQFAISQRTTVYMVFLPSQFWGNNVYPNANRYNALVTQAPNEARKAAYLYDNQLNSYAIVALRSAGDQPGTGYPRYLVSWRTLPEGTFIAPQKFIFPTQKVSLFDPLDQSRLLFDIYGFSVTNNIPFPSEEAFLYSTKPYIWLPYLEFNYLGQMVSDKDATGQNRDAYIPLARGSLAHAYNVNKVPLQQAPSIIEKPPGNSTNSYNVIHVDWLTGRAKVRHPEVQ